AMVNFVDHKEALELGTMASAGDSPNETVPAAYPSFKTSRALTFRNLYFAFSNWDFSLLMGFIYFIFGTLVALRDRPDMYVFVGMVFGGALIGYTVKQEVSTKFKIWGSSALHAAAHVAVLIFAARWFVDFNAGSFTRRGEWWELWKWLGLMAAEMIPIGFLAG